MSRPLRVQYPHAHYHICMRGNERKRIFGQEKDYRHFCDLLKNSCERFNLKVYAFVLMSNHAHLMLETCDANLSDAMHWIKTSYSVWFNRSRNRAGHLFQGRYYSVLIEDESYYLELSRYIHLNPVRAGRVKRPEDYLWSSCGDYVRNNQKWPWIDREPLLSELGGKGMKRYREYYKFLIAGIEFKDDAWDQFRRGVIMGSEEFKAWVAEKFETDSAAGITGLHEIRAGERMLCKEADEILRREIKAAPELQGRRDVLMYALYKMGYRLQEIADIYGVSYSAVSQNARRMAMSESEKSLFEKIMSNVKR